MKSLKTTSLFLLLSVSLTVFGQTENESKESHHIEVIGKAEKSVVPDEIFISIVIREREEGKEKISVDQQEAALKEELLSIGVPLKDLSLTDVDANYVRVRRTKKELSVKNEYVLKVGDASTVSQVFEKLDELKIVEAHISRVSHSKLPELQKEVRILAIKAAKDKAEYLLSAIDEKVGKPIYVYEQSPSYNDDELGFNVRGARSVSNVVFLDGVKVRGGSPMSESIGFQKIKLQSSIYVKFEII